MASNNIVLPKPQSVIPFVAMPALEDTEVNPLAAVCQLETVKEAIDPGSNSEKSREGQEAVPGGVEKEKPLLLHVDDDRGYRKFMRRTMEEAGFAVVEAGNGREALDQLTMKKIGMVISELTMPVSDGFEMIGEMRKRRIDIPVIFVMSFYDDESYLNSMHLGAYDCVSKLDGEMTILRIVRDAIKSRIGTEKGESNDIQKVADTFN